MIRIRRIYNAVLPSDRERIEQVKEIFRENSSAIADCADTIPHVSGKPFRCGYRTVLPASESGSEQVTGFSLELLFPEINSALLDIDFHHGDGAQDVFWRRSDVLTLSIHGRPNIAYPYFSGFADEVGEGPGKGLNRNVPLPENAGDTLYLAALDRALDMVTRFRLMFLVVPLGFDTMPVDPTGSFALTLRARESIGRKLAGTQLPLLLVQKSGDSLRNLRRGLAARFLGLALGLVGFDRAPTVNQGAKK